MPLLIHYLRRYWPLVALALLLAAVNQIFSLLDPLIFRYIIDRYATKYHQYTTAQFIGGVSLLLGAAVGVAFVSRVAKNFQDYYVNVVTQRTGAQLYADGVERSLSLPYAVFEDQRSGETLGKLQKVGRTSSVSLPHSLTSSSRQRWASSLSRSTRFELIGSLRRYFSRQYRCLAASALS